MGSWMRPTASRVSRARSAPRRWLVVIAALVPALFTASVAAGGVPAPVYPAAGAVVKVTPPAGFANGDIDFRWSITYPDCPGPDSIHSSYVEFHEVGKGDFKPTQRGGPFVGNGTFTTPGNVFPKSVATHYEWRVFWACGATIDFAGSQGRSDTVAFTLAPLGGGSALRVAAFGRTPLVPRAGRRVTATLRLAGSPLPARGSVVCKGGVGRKGVKPVVHRYAKGVARCSWLLPRSARGARFTGSVTLKASGKGFTRRFAARVPAQTGASESTFAGCRTGGRADETHDESAPRSRRWPQPCRHLIVAWCPDAEGPQLSTVATWATIW